MMDLFNQPKKKMIADLEVGDRITWFYRITEYSTRHKRDGSPYMTLTLMDSSGKVSGKLWQKVDRYAGAIEPGAIHKISGQVTEYRGKPELRIEDISPLEQHPELNESDFQETSPIDSAAVFADLLKLLHSHVKQPALQELVRKFEEHFGDLFRAHYGAQKIHHAYIGGLAEHTLSMAKMAITVAEHYSLDRDVLLVGCLFHDIGKLEEYRIQPTLETTAQGGLLGHIILGHTITDNMIRQIKDFPEDLRLHLLHLIISHHGEREFGSPEVPKTAEAFVLHLIDLLDSKLNIFRQVQSSGGDAQLFSEYIPVLQRRIFLQRNRAQKPDDESGTKTGRQ